MSNVTRCPVSHFLLLAAISAGCAAVPPGPGDSGNERADSGTVDSGSGNNDASINDAGLIANDAGLDAGRTDAGRTDAGAILPGDGGVRPDAGVIDGGTLIFVGDFEAPGNFSAGTTYSQFSTNIDTCEVEASCTTDSMERVNSPVRRGGYALRVTLHEGDTQSTSGTRSELQTRGKYTTALDEDIWYGWSVFVPATWVVDANDMKVIHQWHTGGSNPGPSPIIGLRIRGANWEISRELVNGQSSVALWQDTLQKGQWVDWVMHIKWSPTNSGSFTAWRDGVQIYTETAQNLATGTTTGEHYQKFGLYGAFTGAVTERVLYYDELRVARGPTGYALVAP